MNDLEALGEAEQLIDQQIKELTNLDQLND